MTELESEQHAPNNFNFKVRLFFNISLGIFLFILFFQPVNLLNFEFENTLIFIAGMAAIPFIIFMIFYNLLPKYKSSTAEYINLESNASFIFGAIAWILIGTAFVFYYRYVGHVRMSFFIVFKIALIALAPFIVIKLVFQHLSLLADVEILREKNLKLNLLIKDVVAAPDQVISFESDNKSEKIDLLLGKLMLIKSADNYINIVFRDKEKISQKLIRTTLKNAELILKEYPDMIRCHRTCIVNMKYVVKINKSYQGYSLKILDYAENISISRQYTLKVNEAFESLA